ncbi:hypothetical protein FSP39_004523 [Pinctada imbricata]|uniref:EF-hand domain-containing protein n=1 Tax=Pinctada imbricata TaxID=66713 RepID=A0AA88Y240_PINIB|nr:hypothetical protein FSP39_004523 [Pinctada imbricata]
MAPKLKIMEPKEELLDAFKTFDRDGNGFISAEELKHVMGSMGDVLSDSEVKAMIREADMDGDGQINYKGYF